MFTARRDDRGNCSNNVVRRVGELPRSIAPSRSTTVAVAAGRIEIVSVPVAMLLILRCSSRCHTKKISHKRDKSTEVKPPKVSLCFLCLLWLIFLPTGAKPEVVIEFHSIEDAVEDGNFDLRVV